MHRGIHVGITSPESIERSTVSRADRYRFLRVILEECTIPDNVMSTAGIQQSIKRGQGKERDGLKNCRSKSNMGRELRITQKINVMAEIRIDRERCYTKVRKRRKVFTIRHRSNNGGSEKCHLAVSVDQVTIRHSPNTLQSLRELVPCWPSILPVNPPFHPQAGSSV